MCDGCNEFCEPQFTGTLAPGWSAGELNLSFQKSIYFDLCRECTRRVSEAKNLHDFIAVFTEES